MALRGGVYRFHATCFLNGGTGQLADKEEIVNAAAIARLKKIRESECSNDYIDVITRIEEYKKRQQTCEELYYLMKQDVEELGLPFLKSGVSLSGWMELHNLDEDPDTWLENHYSEFSDIYESYAEEAEVFLKKAEETTETTEKSQDFVVDTSYD